MSISLGLNSYYVPTGIVCRVKFLLHKFETLKVVDRIGEKRTLLNNILRRNANWIGHILRRNCLLHDAIERHMTEVKGVERRKTTVPR